MQLAPNVSVVANTFDNFEFILFQYENKKRSLENQIDMVKGGARVLRTGVSMTAAFVGSASVDPVTGSLIAGIGSGLTEAISAVEENAVEKLKKEGLNVGLINARFIKP